jgi:hypothetical protein
MTPDRQQYVLNHYEHRESVAAGRRIFSERVGGSEVMELSLDEFARYLGAGPHEIERLLCARGYQLDSINWLPKPERPKKRLGWSLIRGIRRWFAVDPLRPRARVELPQSPRTEPPPQQVAPPESTGSSTRDSGGSEAASPETDAPLIRDRHGTDDEAADEDAAPRSQPAYLVWKCLCCGVAGPGTPSGHPNLYEHHAECPERWLAGDSEDLCELKAKVALCCRRFNDEMLLYIDAEIRASNLAHETRRLRTFYATNYPPPCHLCFGETTFAAEFSAEDLHSYRCRDCGHILSRPPLA